MIKLILIFGLILNFSYANSKVYTAYSLAIYNSKGEKELIKNKAKTKEDYQGVCISEVFVNFTKNTPYIEVKIGNSIGHKISSKAVYKNNIKVGEIIKFKHYGVNKGYLSIKVNNKIYDQKTFIK